MKTTAKQLLFAAPIFFALLISLSSFAPAAGNPYANGGGIAGDIHFNFNAVEQKDGSVVGHIQYDGTYYYVECVEWLSATSAIIYASTSASQDAFMVTDGGEGSNAAPDQISSPVTWTVCDNLDATAFTLANVSAGNIQIK